MVGLSWYKQKEWKVSTSHQHFLNMCELFVVVVVISSSTVCLFYFFDAQKINSKSNQVARQSGSEWQPVGEEVVSWFRCQPGSSEGLQWLLVDRKLVLGGHWLDLEPE